MSAHNRRFKSATLLRRSRDDESPVNHASDAPGTSRTVSDQCTNLPTDLVTQDAACPERNLDSVAIDKCLRWLFTCLRFVHVAYLLHVRFDQQLTCLPFHRIQHVAMHSFFCAVSNHQMPFPAPACGWMPRVQKSSFLLSSCTAHNV